MILMYHKIDIVVPTKWWVSVAAFERQINELSNYDFVFLDNYEPDNPKQCVITFDDSYENVYRHAFPILRKRCLPFEIFINASYLADWNNFNKSEPLTRFCSVDQLEIMAANGARIQWHSNYHQILTDLSIDGVISELEIPADLLAKFPEPNFRWFAYPYGMHNEMVRYLVAQRFRGALSVEDGIDGDRYQIMRSIVTDDSKFD